MRKSKSKDSQAVCYAGTSGLVLPVPKYRFPHEYRDASRLMYYATCFNSIEINSTFYRLPLARTVSRWAAEVPNDFRFTFKLWQELSHKRDLHFKAQDMHRFFEVISGAGSKKGCVLIQLPPAVTRASMKRVEAILSSAADCNSGEKWNIAVEFRHRSWYQEETYALLRQFGAALVIHDMPQSAGPLVSTADFMYLRFHGPEGKYRGSYPEHQLAEYAGYVREWLKEGKTVYSYFNNTMGDAFNNQEMLSRLIRSSENQA